MGQNNIKFSLLTLRLTGQKKNLVSNLVVNATVRKLVQSGWKVMQGIENSAKGSGKFPQSSGKPHKVVGIFHEVGEVLQGQ